MKRINVNAEYDVGHPVSNADANGFTYFELYGDRIRNSKSKTMYISSDC
jgi:hypothetical protein